MEIRITLQSIQEKVSYDQLGDVCRSLFLYQKYECCVPPKWECLVCKQIFTQSCHLNRHSENSSRNRGKTKLICNGVKINLALNSKERVFYVWW